MKGYRHRAVYLLLIVAAAGFAVFAGCTPEQKYAVEKFFKTDKTRFLDPSKPIKAPEYASLMPILSSASVVDSSQIVFPNATRPTDEDMSYSAVDYVIGPGDVMDIGVMDLFSDGVETVLRRQVSESGFIDMPLLDKKIKADGLTQQQLKDAIVNAYSPNILQSPEVSISLLSQRQSTYSVLGAVARPAVYNVTGKDMRLLEALALAGGITQVNIRYIYVFRQLPATRLEGEGEEGTAPPAAKGEKGQESDELPELPPEVLSKQDIEKKDELDKLEDLDELNKTMLQKSDEQPEAESEDRNSPPGTYMLSETSSVAGGGDSASESESPKKKADKWVYSNGRWVRVTQEAGVAEKPSGEGAAPVRPAGEKPEEIQPEENSDPFGWKKADKSTLGRIIAIDLDKLDKGDPRMNIVIRDKDVIRVPTLEVGEFYVMGEVPRPGVYQLTGRSITMKQALAAAGGPGPLAWLPNTVLVRRIGENQEQTIPVDLEAVMRGEEPDLMLKPNDVLAIGTSAAAPFMAVIRNAFRMTYGFGFIYDRNFGDMYETLDSKRFTRW